MDANTLNNQYNSSISSVNDLVSGINSTFDRITNTVEANNAAAAAAADRYNKWSASQAEITREYNSIEAAKNRNWQEMMSNTAHQREVKDLLAAGLNPILSATGGSGASVGSGATAAASSASGSKADTDNSASTAIVQLFGHQLDTMTKLAEGSVSALTSMANTDKTTAASRFAAQLGLTGTMYSTDRSPWGMIGNALSSALGVFGSSLSTWPADFMNGLKNLFESSKGDTPSEAAKKASGNEALSTSNKTLPKVFQNHYDNVNARNFAMDLLRGWRTVLPSTKNRDFIRSLID